MHACRTRRGFTAAAAKGKTTGCQTTTAIYGKAAKVERNVQAMQAQHLTRSHMRTMRQCCNVGSNRMGKVLDIAGLQFQEAHRGIRDSGMATPEI
jgi:hypothetical protein